MKQLPKAFYQAARFPIYAGLALSGCLALQSALAGGIETPVFFVPMTPGVSVAGAFVDFNSGWADALVPVFRTTPSSFLYLNPQGLYHSDDQYSASIGGGFRALTQSDAIVGVYVFGDYNHSQQNHSYWFISPGLEWLGETLDFSVNFYFPVSSQRNDLNGGFASQFGKTDHIFFSGHTEFDTVVQNFESTGPGVDGEIGYRLPFLANNTKLYLGGYYFAPKNNDSIGGGMVKLDVPVTDMVSLTVSDSYDNIFHNTVRVGGSISLWGRGTHYSNHSIETRMVDPIQRNRIAEEGHSGTDQYIAEGQETLGPRVLLDNIWFFNQNGTPPPAKLGDSAAATASLGQCTYENPCPAVDVNTNFFAGINAIAPNAVMFLAPATYSTLSDASSFGGTLVLNPGQSMYGRTADYTLAAVGNDRALLIGNVSLPGNTLLDSLRLANDGIVDNTGLTVQDNAVQVSLSHVLIGNTGSDPSAAYAFGVVIGDQDAVSILNSEVDTFSSSTFSRGVTVNGSHSAIQIDHSVIASVGLNQVAEAIFSLNTGGFNNLLLTNNQITATNSGIGGGSDGIFSRNTHDNIWNIINNQISATSDNGESDGIIAIVIQNSSWNLVNNTITSITHAGAEANGILERGVNTTWNLTNNTITVVASPIDAAFGAGLQVAGAVHTVHDETWTLTGNKIFVSDSGATNSTLDGILVGGAQNENLTLKSNQIIVNNLLGSNNTANGVKAGINNNNTWDLSDNQITASTSGSGGTSLGLFFDDSVGAMWTLMHNRIEADVTANSTAAAVLLFDLANSNQIDSTQDTFIGKATDTGSNAYGFSSQNGANSNQINLTQDNIQATAINGDAIGLNDPANTNAWSFDSFTFEHIQVSTLPPGMACKTLFGGMCS